MVVQKYQQKLMEPKTGEHVISPRAHIQWIGPHEVEMEALLHWVQMVEVVGRLALLKFEVNWCLWHTATMMHGVWLTFPHDTGHWIDHQGELPCVFSVTLTYMMCKEDDIDMGQTSNQVHMSLWIVTAQKLWMSHDRGGWGLILQCYACM